MIGRMCGKIACPTAVLAGIAVISAGALAAALTAQYVYGLQPCILCLYQRAPFVIALVLSLIGLAFFRKNAAMIAALCALAFAVNAVIAFYHVGVEQHWWVSFLEGCAVPDLGNDPAALLENIMNAKPVRCDEIAWVDPVFGQSMAVYNVVLCTGLAVFCGLSTCFLKKKD